MRMMETEEGKKEPAGGPDGILRFFSLKPRPMAYLYDGNKRTKFVCCGLKIILQPPSFFFYSLYTSLTHSQFPTSFFLIENSFFILPF